MSDGAASEPTVIVIDGETPAEEIAEAVETEAAADATLAAASAVAAAAATVDHAAAVVRREEEDDEEWRSVVGGVAQLLGELAALTEMARLTLETLAAIQGEQQAMAATISALSIPPPQPQQPMAEPATEEPAATEPPEPAAPEVARGKRYNLI